MTSAEYLSNYIKKLGHPIREIRERSLQLLTAKLRLGWEIEDELSGTRELLEALLAWFHVQKPTLQREALQLLLSTLMTKAGNYIIKEYGVKRLLSKLDALKHKIDEDAHDTYRELIESIQFLNIVEEGSNVDVPRLTIPSVTSSDSDRDSNQDYLTGLRNDYQSSRDGSISNEDPVNVSKDHNGIRLLLFPWVSLTSSDSKTVMLVEDALKLLKSTRRCCRFICDVFLRDFPAEIFLNRPSIVQNLLSMANTGQGGRLNEVLLVLLSITQTLNKRVFELSSVDLVNDAYKIIDSKETDDGMNAELQELAGNSSPELQDDTLAALRQWPAPLYALETTHTVLTIMARSVVLVDPEDKSEVLDVKTLNTCLSLVESLIQLLLECVKESFWIADHTSKTHRDIAHKSCMVMRLLGDLLTKYKKSYTNYPELSHHRVAWFRLVKCAEKLLRWARRSALPPSSLMVALQAAQLDPALELFYPSLSEDVCEVLQSTKISTSNEFKTKYQELSRLIEAMDAAVKFMKNKNSCRSSKQVLKIIKKSLPVIEIHLNENYLDEVADILLRKARYMDLSNEDWTLARSIALSLMAHNVNWVAIKFYNQLADMVKSVLVDEDINQIDNEKCLTLLGDVSILTEICCHGMSSNIKEVETSAIDIMLYLLRGRMVLSESCWWRLLASLLPILPLLHVYAAHDTEIGQAICKSLEPEISECMGVSATENMMGLVRLLFVQCVAVRMEAAHQLCRLLGDQRYLPPRESLRNDVLLNALRRIKPQSFNVDYSSSPSKTHQTGLSQILDVLKQDIVLDENGKEYVTRPSGRPSLEPSLRRSSLQQLSVLMRQQGAHDAFLRCDGIQLIVAILRMSLMVDDYLAFPECAISCVSILNSVCFASRHVLAKIHDLPSLLIREWLLSDDDWRASVRIRWWCAWESPSRVLKGAPPPPAPLALRPTADDLTLLRTASSVHEATKALLALENATSHKQVSEALNILESYTHLAKWSPECADFGALPWQHMRRFLCAPPASPRDTALLIALLHFIVAYMDNLPSEAGAHSWIKSCFLGKDTSIIALLSRDRLFPQQTAQDNIEITQLHIHIIKVLLRCVVLLESYDDFDSSRLESLVKILLACLEKVDLRNFHMLGYLNELMRCIRYALYSRYCKLSESTRDSCLALVTRTLSGCCAGSGRKGQACRLDAVLSLLAMLRQIHEEGIPPQRWSEAWSGDAVRCVVACAGSARASLRAAALRVLAQLARYSQLSPQLLQAIPSESMAQYAVSFISNEREANAVRAAAATLLTVVASRPSHYTDVLESEILQQLQEYNFLETCIEIFVEFCNEIKYQNQIEPNVPMSLLERRSELEVRAEKCADVRISPSIDAQVRRAPTASLVAALADVLHNVAVFKRCPVQAWNEQGLYRLLFRCASWSRCSPLDNNRVRAASCRALVAAAPYKCVRSSLAATKDCLYNLMMTLTPLDDDELNVDALAARTQALLLLGSLLPDQSTSDSVWTQLRNAPSAPFFKLLLQCLESDVTDFQDAAVFCLIQLSQSAANRKHPDKTQDESCIQLLDNMKALRFDNRDLSAGDAKDCQPEYLVEELCWSLMQIYQNMALQGNVHESSQDERWCRLCSCLASLLSVSARGRLYSVHRQFPRTLLATLQTVRDRLSVLGQPVEVIRNANNNPILRTLYWLLTLISCLMTDCLPAKESLAEDNIALSLNRLWPWCMMTEPLREAVVHLLLTFTNNCPKAWSAMCLCVAGRSLLLECCSLLSREAAAAGRARSELALLACVRVLRHTVGHHHCRAVILKVHPRRRAARAPSSRCWPACACCGTPSATTTVAPSY
ncbi:uncharacterized protein LOC133520923 isoform X2 [Cydia pomonella]|uniref:uncharacterized protein LOC133520923 isoform X2 n=1 Tax=Cydia pomonella TaxID=82600 RepID=UPI002ADDE48D|nr:uncharacterized protein LOC133520923 isoform X2 [Cydia pomonella]